METIEDVARITALIKVTEQVHRDPLRKLRFLVKSGAYSLEEVAAMAVDDLADALAKAVTSRNGNEPKNPVRVARQILRRLRDAALACTDASLPCPPPLSVRPKLLAMPVAKRPARYIADLADWKEINSLQQGREVRGITALKFRTFGAYTKHWDQTLTLAETVGGPLGNDVGIRQLTEKKLVSKMVAELQATKTPWTVMSYICPWLRAAVDLFGNDESHSEAIAHLKQELVRWIPSPGLTAIELLELDNLAENKLFAATLRNAPDAIVMRSDAPGLCLRDRLARIAAAFAIDVKLRFPSVTVDYMARFDVAKHVRTTETGRELLLPDPCSGEAHWVACPPSSERILGLWEAKRTRNGIEINLLFAVRNRRLKDGETPETAHQDPKTVGAFVTDELEIVMGMRLGYRKLKSYAIRAATRAFPDESAAIAQAAGIKNLEYFQRRWTPEGG